MFLKILYALYNVSKNLKHIRFLETLYKFIFIEFHNVQNFLQLFPNLTNFSIFRINKIYINLTSTNTIVNFGIIPVTNQKHFVDKKVINILYSVRIL